MNVKYLDVWSQIRKLTSTVKRELDLALMPADLRVFEFQIMNCIRENGPSTMSNISHALTVSRTGTAMLVEGVEAKGFVRRRKSDTDRRVVFVSLTPKGLKKLDEALDLQQALAKKKLECLSDSELNELNVLLGRLLESA